MKYPPEDEIKRRIRSTFGEDPEVRSVPQLGRVFSVPVGRLDVRFIRRGYPAWYVRVDEQGLTGDKRLWFGIDNLDGGIDRVCEWVLDNFFEPTIE